MYVSVGIGKPPGPEGVPAKKESHHECARMGKIIVVRKWETPGSVGELIQVKSTAKMR